MMFFSGLALFFSILWLAGKIFGIEVLQSYPAIGTYAAAIMFIIVGIMHFARPAKLEAMIPGVLRPFARAINYGSGILEIFLGVLLFFPQTQIVAAWGLIGLLVLIFPANINVAFKKPNTYNISRLFFQPVYILWVWFFSLYLNQA